MAKILSCSLVIAFFIVGCQSYESFPENIQNFIDDINDDLEAKQEQVALRSVMDNLEDTEDTIDLENAKNDPTWNCKKKKTCSKQPNCVSIDSDTMQCSVDCKSCRSCQKPKVVMGDKSRSSFQSESGSESSCSSCSESFTCKKDDTKCLKQIKTCNP